MSVNWLSAIEIICTTLRKSPYGLHRPVSQTFLHPTLAFKTVPMFVWLTVARHSRPLRKIDNRFLFLHLSSRRSMVWCPAWLCAAGNVSESSTRLQIFRNASHLWQLLCPPFYLLAFGDRTVHCSAAASIAQYIISSCSSILAIRLVIKVVRVLYGIWDKTTRAI